MSVKSRVIERVKKLTLSEVLMVFLLICSYGIFDRLGALEEHIRHVEDNVVDLHNEVSSESSDIQTKLDEQKDVLEQIEGNQP
jgi:hypothetical protein